MSSQFLSTALDAVKAAEEVVLFYFNREKIEQSTKSDTSPVTIADQKAEQTIRTVISTAFPAHGFIGEEEGVTNPDAEYQWTIDPIDGTTSFLRNMPFFSTELALLHDREIIMGVSYNHCTKECLTAVKGEGAYLNQTTRLQVSKIATIREAFGGFGSYASFQKSKTEANFSAIAGDSYEVRSYGSFPSNLLLAQGKIDYYLSVGPKIWDLAARTCIIREAGGTVTDMKGHPITLNSTSYFATNSLLHDQVLRYFNA